MTVLRHGHILTIDENCTEYEDGFIIFDHDGIIALGPDSAFPDTVTEWEDVRGKLVLPGLVNTHTHLGMVPFRSLGDDCPDRLFRFLFPLENRAMNEELAVASAKIAIAEMLCAGITCAVDMYYYEAAIAEAAEKMGFRLFAGETLLDGEHPGAGNFAESLEKTEECIEKCRKLKLVKPIVAPHAPYSLAPENLIKCYETARSNNLKWTMHLEELPREMDLFKDLTPIEWMESEGILDESLLAVHLLLATDNDLELLKKRNVSFAHCPVSNAKAAKGVAKAPELASSIPVTLGTDGPSSGNTLDLFTQMRTYAYLHKNRLKDRAAVPAKTIVPLATCNAGRALGEKIGQLKKGYESDIITVSMDDWNTIPAFDPYSTLVYSAEPGNVKDVYVCGRKLVEDGHLTSVDEEELKKEFKEASRDFYKKALKLM